MSSSRDATILPASTVFEECNIVAPGDIVISDHARLGYGVVSPGRVFVGEGVAFEGGLEAEDDVYLDRFTRVQGGVRAGGAAYVGEGSRVHGRLVVQGDLDVGDNVSLESGFEAHGWITIRNPIPMVMYVFLYVLQLLHAGKSDEVQRVLDEMDRGAEATLVVREGYLHIPANAIISTDEVRLPGEFRVGRHCRILGNHRVRGDVLLGGNSELHGALRCTGDVTLKPNSVVQGNVEATGTVVIGQGVTIWGEVQARKVEMVHGSMVHGEVQATDGIKFIPVPAEHMVDTVDHMRDGKPQDMTSLLD